MGPVGVNSLQNGTDSLDGRTKPHSIDIVPAAHKFDRLELLKTEIDDGPFRRNAVIFSWVRKLKRFVPLKDERANVAVLNIQRYRHSLYGGEHFPVLGK